MAALTLADLRPGQSGYIDGYAPHSTGTLVQRLMQLGLIEDTPVTVVRRAPAGDPLEVKVLDYALSLRADEAGLILIREPH